MADDAAVPNRPTRPLTIIVRAVPHAAAEGRVVGHVEIVDSGDIVPIADVGELVDLLRRLAESEGVELGSRSGQ